jgi:hypothetical protein
MGVLSLNFVAIFAIMEKNHVLIWMKDRAGSYGCSDAACVN